MVFRLSFPGTFAMAWMFKKRLLAGSMPSGFKMTPQVAASLAPESITTATGLAELHAAVERLEREPNRATHPIFGNLSKEEYDTLNLKHASMHMSFLVPA